MEEQELETNKKEYPKFKRFMFRVFEEHNPHDPLCVIVDIFYILLILLAVTFTILEVCGVLGESLPIRITEYVMFSFFAIEWISSLYTADIEFSNLPYWKAKLRWIFSIESICDFICLTLFLISFMPIKNMSEESEIALRFIALLKLVRIYKWFKYPMFKKITGQDKNHQEN